VQKGTMSKPRYYFRKRHGKTLAFFVSNASQSFQEATHTPAANLKVTQKSSLFWFESTLSIN